MTYSRVTSSNICDTDDTPVFLVVVRRSGGNLHVLIKRHGQLHSVTQVIHNAENKAASRYIRQQISSVSW
jgi:hypothetical protein